MRSLLCLVVFLPCLLAAEVKTIYCPNGIECPFGKTCCQLPNGFPGCCDVPEEQLKNADLCPALPPASTLNHSLVTSQAQSFYCPGTMCFSTNCCPHTNAACCPSNHYFCCESYARCCSNSLSARPWCCRKDQRCHSIYGYCLGGAASLKIALVPPLLLAFVMVVASKYLY